MSGILQGVVASIGGAIKDAYFNLVTLLLPGNGTNGAQNNTFLDSSTNNFTITRNGNTTQGTFSPFSQTGWGNYFDGSGDYLSVTRTQALSGDFTIEAWYYPVVSQAGALFTLGSYTQSTGLELYFNSSKVPILYSSGGSQITGSAFSLDTWTHFAVVRSGTTIRLYINGIAVGTTYTSSASFSTVTYIGVEAGASPNPSIAAYGYISNFRIVDGTAVYTSNFTPPTTPLAAITNTVLLTCQSNRFIDNSTNNFAITVNGNTSVQAFSPFAPTAAYSAATVGGSGYFDGTGDYLTTSGTNSAWALGTGDFQISFWLYPQSVSGFRDVFTQQNIGGTPQIFLVNNALRYNNAGIAAILDATTSIKVNEWVYCVLSRVSGTTRWFINGAAAGSVSDTNNWSNTNGWYVSTNAQPYQGYIADVRLVKGSGVTSSTVPTAPDTAITNTQFLVGFTNAGITDATSKNVLETVGNAQISTAQSKFGGSSMYFDGTGDWCSMPMQPWAYFGSSDVTVEAWIYPTSFSTSPAIFARWTSSVQADRSYVFYINTSGFPIFTVEREASAGPATVTSNIAVSLNTWSHVAYVKNGGTWYIFVNGVQGISYSALPINAQAGAATIVPIVGATATGNAFNGYIDDLRVTKGYARYTTTFTPPATAFPLQ